MNIYNMMPDSAPMWQCLHAALPHMPQTAFTDLAHADAVFCDSKIVAEGLPDTGALPIYAFERLDGAQIMARKPLWNPRVRLVKMYCAEPMEAHNGNCQPLFRRLHVPLLAGGRVDYELVTPTAPLKASEYERIRLGPSFLHLRSMLPTVRRYAQGTPRWEDRDIDILMVDTVEYGERPDIKLIQRHRQKAIDDVLAAGGRYRVRAEAGRPYSKADWVQLLGRARIVVSPWGLGEACYREYEGVLAGCRVLKPASPYTIRSSCHLLSQPYDAITPVPPMDMLNVPDLDQLLHSPPEAGARCLLLQRQPIEWLGQRLWEICHDDGRC